MKRRIFGFLDLIRVPATMQLSSWVLIGTLLAFRDMDSFHPDLFLRVFLGAFLGIGGGMALNDWVDRKFDEMRIRESMHYDEKSRLAKCRPIVVGLVSSKEAALLTLFCLLSVVLIASTAPFPRNFYVLVLIAYFVFAELLYQKIRHTIPFSFPVIASIFGLWPIVGYIAVSRVFPTILLTNLFLIAFFWEVCHNQYADVIDIENDIAMGLRTPPIVYGTKLIGYTIMISSVAVLVSSLTLSTVGDFGPLYVSGAVLADLLYLKSGYDFLKQPNLENALNGFATAKKYAVFLFFSVVLDMMIHVKA